MLVLGFVYIFVFLLQIFLIFLISRSLIKQLGVLFFKITHSQQMTVQILAIIFLPGTIVHELSHALTAGVLMVHVGDLEFIPEVREDGIKLGSAQIGETDPIRRALIGFAPVFVGIAVLLLISYFLTNYFNFENYYSFITLIIILFSLFVVSNSMFSSPKDLEGTLFAVVFFLSFFAAIYLISLFIPGSFVSDLKIQFLNWLFIQISNNLSFLKTANLLLVVPLLVDLITIGTLKLFLRKV